MTDQTPAEQSVRFLDLDALAEDVGVTIKINGNSHKMAAMTVADFVWAQSMAAKQAKMKENPTEDETINMFDGMLDLMCRQFPTCPRADMESLSFSKLGKLVQFTGNLGTVGAEAAVVEAAEGGKVELVVTDKEM